MPPSLFATGSGGGRAGRQGGPEVTAGHAEMMSPLAADLLSQIRRVSREPWEVPFLGMGLLAGGLKPFGRERADRVQQTPRARSAALGDNQVLVHPSDAARRRHAPPPTSPSCPPGRPGSPLAPAAVKVPSPVRPPVARRREGLAAR